MFSAPRTFGMKRQVYLVDYSGPKYKYQLLYAGFAHPFAQKNATDSIFCLLWTQMKYESGGGGIRTHDDADERRTLSEHGYGRSDMK